MIWEEVEKKYGKEFAAKMKKHLHGVTCTVRKNGKPDYPESDIHLTYKIVKGKKVHPFEWD